MSVAIASICKLSLYLYLLMRSCRLFTVFYGDVLLFLILYLIYFSGRANNNYEL